jgi:predicted acetyltransferase
LPKLYKYDYEPAVSSYVAIDDGKLKAAVGAFDHDITVCGHYLKTRGIGNVAVHPYTRGSGYMKKLMNIALDDMIADGVVLTVLGGRRQRYNYFSYDKLGSAISMSFNSDNMRHIFGKDRKHQLKFSTLKENDLDAIKEIKTLSESKPYYAIRSDEKYFEILSSWAQKTYVGYIDNEFIGYAVVKSGVSEMLLKDESMIQEFVCALFDHLGNSSLQISIPAFLPNYVDALIGICESYCLETSKFFSVLNYKKVVEAFMELKATYTDLPDGKIVLDINGKAGNEKIAVSVNNGKISVEYTDDAADLTLEHIEAMNLLFAPISIKRDRLPDFVKMWFPLPIYVYSSDAV